MAKKIQIYTDGACRGNPGPGGWGALLLAGERQRELSGGEPLTTNNRMELMAVIRALEALRRPSQVTVFTDSRYIQLGITEWIDRWVARGWRTSAGKPVKNRDLWEELYALAQRHKIHWRWVQGHSGVAGNERVDQLARQAIDGFTKMEHACDK